MTTQHQQSDRNSKQSVAPVLAVWRARCWFLPILTMVFAFISSGQQLFGQNGGDPEIVRPSGYHVQLQGPSASGAQPQSTGTAPSLVPSRSLPVSLPSKSETQSNSNAAHFAPVQPSPAPPVNAQPSLVQSASWTSPPASPNSLTSNSTNSVESSEKNSNSRLSALEIKSPSKGLVGGVEKPKSTWAAALSMMLSLAIVLCLFMLVAYIFKKSQPPSFVKLPSAVVQVMGRSPMAPRQQMYVVRFGSKLLLVSHQNGQTQTLSEITDIDEVTRLSGLCEANSPTSITHSFRDVFRQVASGKRAREAA